MSKIKSMSKIKRKWKEICHDRYLYLMLVPAVAYVIVFNYLPMPGMVLAFKQYNYSKGIFGSDWIGLKNFGFLFRTGAISRITWNTIVYNLFFIFFDIFFQVTVAVFLSEMRNKYYKKITQTVLLLPFFISWVVAGAIVYNLLNTNYGLINSILVSLGREKISFMNNAKIWPGLFVAFHVWKGLGYGSVVYLAAITGIDQELYDAAQIDGAGVFQRVFKITIPLLKPTVVVMLLLSLGRVVRGDFEMFYNLTGNNAMIYNVSDVIDTFVYRAMTQTQNFGMAAAAGLYQSILGFIIVLIFNRLIKKLQPDYSLF